MSDGNSFELELLKQYKSILLEPKNRPEWAVKKQNNKKEIVFPGIPFVGNKYKQTGILLYASAENLIDYNGWLDEDNHALNRRRNYLADGKFFPSLHIAPVYDGSLIIVSAYILDILKKYYPNLESIDYETPYEYVENIAVDNFGKFTIEPLSHNIDYASNYNCLQYSMPYVKADLEILRPKFLIIPKTIYQHDEVRKIINSIVPDCLVIPIYQINSRTINRIISKKYAPKRNSDINDRFIKWQENLGNKITGKTNENFNSVYSYLDKILEQCLISRKNGA